MINSSKYSPQFFSVKKPTRKWADKIYIEKAPTWCSVDLRDGNQALMIPMSLEEKLEFFKLLCKIGFKEIVLTGIEVTDYQYDLCELINSISSLSQSFFVIFVITSTVNDISFSVLLIATIFPLRLLRVLVVLASQGIVHL